MKKLFGSLITIAIFSTWALVQPASAGLMDALNNAKKKLDEVNQNSQQKSQDWAKQQQLHGSDRNPDGSCVRRSATCMDYDVTMNKCLAPLNGYRSKITAELIERKLKEEELTPQLRKNLEEDLVIFKEAAKNKTDTIKMPNAKDNQRYLMDISQDDQVEINSKYGKKYQEIMNKCMGADHMGIGKRTEMNYIQDDDGLARNKKSDKVFSDLKDCMKETQGLRYKLIADHLENKIKNMNLSAKDREDWEADIASYREAGEQNLMMPKAVDPQNPSRALMRLSMDDQMAVNQLYGTQSQEMIAQCSAQADKNGKVTERKPRSGGLVDHSQSPANPNAKRVEGKAGRGNQPIPTRVGGGSLSSVLGATKVDYMVGYGKCFDPLKGHIAKVHADALEKKLKASSGLSAQKRKEWEEDIAAWRVAEKASKDQPDPPDPDDPYRWYNYLTKEERQQINKQHLDFNNKIIRDCGAKDAGL